MPTQTLSNSTALLARTPGALDALLRELPEEWTKRNEGGSSWTVLEVMAHLVRTERKDWVPRARFILEHGNTQSLEPVIRDPNADGRPESVEALLDDFAALRAANLEELRGMQLSPADLDKPGSHKALGPIRLSNLLATWVAHDLTHLHQITRILAHQYRDKVGPFERFLGVLHCDGHSKPS